MRLLLDLTKFKGVGQEYINSTIQLFFNWPTQKRVELNLSKVSRIK